MSLKDEIKQQGNWYHNIDINGINTQEDKTDPAERLQEVAEWLPKDLKGKSVLDIGCNAGAECFYCESIGAKTILGVEISPYYVKQANFAKAKLNSKVKFAQANIEEFDICPDIKFDFILCLAFIYHVDNPILVMRKIHKWLKPDGKLIISIQYVKYDGVEDKRVIEFMPYKAALFMPNRTAMRSILDYIGFEIMKEKEILSRRIMFYCKKK